MSESCKCQRELISAFEEMALALGGVAATYRLPDEAIWDLARAFDLACERARTRLSRGGSTEPLQADDAEDREHPAVTHLLSRLHEQQLSVGACVGHRGVRA